MENYKKIAELIKEEYAKDGQFMRVVMDLMIAVHNELGGKGLLANGEDKVVEIDLNSVPHEEIFDYVPEDPADFLKMVRGYMKMQLRWVKAGW